VSYEGVWVPAVASCHAKAKISRATGVRGTGELQGLSDYIKEDELLVRDLAALGNSFMIESWLLLHQTDICIFALEGFSGNLQTDW
jgi:hypothetical protein